jgi:hypothetical protein
MLNMMIGYERVQISGFFLGKKISPQTIEKDYIICQKFPVFLGGEKNCQIFQQEIIDLGGKFLPHSTHFSLLGQFLASFLQF